MPSWHPPDSDSRMVQDDESTLKVHNDANACFFRIPLDYNTFTRLLQLWCLVLFLKYTPMRIWSCFRGLCRILNWVTALSRSSVTSAICVEWRLPFLTGAPLTRTYASPIVSTCHQHTLGPTLTSVNYCVKRYTCRNIDETVYILGRVHVFPVSRTDYKLNCLPSWLNKGGIYSNKTQT